MFGISSSVAFYGKMLEDYDDFVEQSGSSTRHQLHAVSVPHGRMDLGRLASGRLSYMESAGNLR
jgi:hypothetical protein